MASARPAARILADVGDISRFPTEPLRVLDWHCPDRRLQRPASAAPAVARRERRLDHVLYMAGIVQLRHDTAGRAYYRRKRAAGKPRWKRCAAWPAPVRRGLRQLASDALVQDEASPEGTPGRLWHPARPACPRTPALRISHFPDPQT